ncbi:MAG: DUF3343 domain-containing protein [Syntrophomonadaceae bacterium]|nr:DUF3343 domain-containing protein [Syntrophomonadaceae bacterium]
MSSLFKAKDYCVFTFVSTAHAFKAERVLKMEALEHIMIPTPREISTSCGLSIKLFPQDRERYQQLMAEKDVSLERVYHIDPQGIREL